MARLSMAARKKLPSKSFALPGKGTGKGGKGSGSYPIPDPSHGRNALARVSQHGTPEEKKIVRAKVHAKFPNIGKKQMGGVIGGGRPPRAGGAPSIGGPPRGRFGPPRPRIGAGVPATPRAPKPVAAAPAPAGVPQLGGAFKRGGVASFPKPHTYEGGGVTDRVGKEMLTGKREMLPKFKEGGVVGSRSGDQSPAACGNQKGHSGFAAFGIKKG